jgi:hypothetical protein
MKIRNTWILWLVMGTFLPVSAVAQEFSADTISYDSSGKIIRGKVYRGATMIRAESAMPAAGPNRQTFLIVDTAKQVSYTIVPSQKMIMVAHGLGALNKAGIALPVNENPCNSIRGGPAPAGTACKKLGEETVNGRHTTKWEVTEMINGHAGTQVVWVDGNLHSIIKMQFAALMTMELQNIQEGPQAASLFAVPADYRQMDVGGR